MFTLSLTDSLCRYHPGEQAQVWHLDTFFVPSLEILTTKFALNCDLIIPRMGYFMNLNHFLVPRVRNLTKKLQKKRKER